MKRIAESPVQSERSKDQRFHSPMASMSYAGALRSARPPLPLPGVVVPEEGHTLQTEGAMRNNFTVDIFKKNGEDFKGTIKHTDAIKLIFVSALGFKPQDLTGVVPGYRGNPTVLFKTKEVFNIDERFTNLVRFSFLKRSKTSEGEITDTYDCAIRGVRGKEGQRNDPYVWIKVEGSDYQLEPSVIRMWLSQYGTLMTDLTEDKVDLELSSGEEELYQGAEITSGTYSAKMLLHSPIPQFLPIDGKKIRIYHRGILKLCTKCYRHGHLRQGCRNEQDDWLTFVDRFMLGSTLDIMHFGKWSNRIADWRQVNPGLHNSNVEEMVTSGRDERRKRDQRRGDVASIIGHLNAQSQAQVESSVLPPAEEEEEDDRVEEVLPASSSDEEVVSTNKLGGEDTPKVKGNVEAQVSEEEIATGKERKPTSPEVLETEKIESGMNGMSFARSESKNKRRGRETATAAEVIPARTRGEGVKTKMRSTSLGKL